MIMCLLLMKYTEYGFINLINMNENYNFRMNTNLKNILYHDDDTNTVTYNIVPFLYPVVIIIRTVVCPHPPIGPIIHTNPVAHVHTKQTNRDKSYNGKQIL